MAKKKAENQITNLLAYKWHAIYRWKVFNKGYNFVSNLTSIGSLHKNYEPPKL
jgi:hypothetical protein